LLGEAFLAELAPPGWELVDADATPSPISVALSLPVGPEFSAIAELVGMETGSKDAFPIDLLGLNVGVGYEPLRRLSPLVGGSFSLAHVREDADELAGSPQSWPVTVDDSEQAASVGRELARLVSATALPFAEKYSTVDSLLDDQGGDVLTTAALLVAAGRFDEAASVLAAFEARDETRRGRQQRERATYQLRRLIENRGDVVVPSEPPPEKTARVPAAVREWLPPVTAAAAAKLEAIRAVEQRLGDDRDPDAVRAELVTEYERRGVRESPLSIEHTIERICRPPSRGGWSAAADALRCAAAFKSALADPRRRGGQPLPWLAPPARAAYRMPAAPEDVWDRVDVAGEHLAWVQEVFEKAPRAGDIVHLEAWLDSQDAADESADVAVYIGERRAGALTSDTASSYRPLLRAAMTRAELPCLAARLSHPPTYAGYLLELHRPGAVDTAT
jgi:hypothetical protein